MIVHWPDAAFLLLLASFLVTFLVVRHITALIRAGRGWLSDVVIGAMHLHHMVWGVGLVLFWGMAAIAFRPEWPLNVIPAVGFGVGAALLLDEFALMLYLRDVYWSREGRRSVYAVLVMLLVAGLIANQVQPSALPHHSRPVVIAILTAYVLLMIVALAKGKLFICLVAIFLPPVVLIGALRLARPESPWARLFYGRKPAEDAEGAAALPVRRGLGAGADASARFDRTHRRPRVAACGRARRTEEVGRARELSVRGDIVPDARFPNYELADHTRTLSRLSELQGDNGSMVAVRAHSPSSSPRLLSSELSFLDYDARMLDLAGDPALPPLERVRFCSIFSQMLDEFFSVRLRDLISQVEAGITCPTADGRVPAEALRDVRARALELRDEQGRIWAEEIIPVLNASGIEILGMESLSPHELAMLKLRYWREFHPILTPLAAGPGQPFAYISALSTSLAAFVCDPTNGVERLAQVKIPDGLPRYIAVDDTTRFVPLEELLAYFLPNLFPAMKVTEQAAFRVTRDGDYEVSDEAEDLLQAVERELRERRFGEATRVEVASGMSPRMRERIQSELGVEATLLHPVSGTLDLSSVAELTALDRADLKIDPWVPIARPLGRADVDHFTAIRSKPRLVHHPYDSFAATYEAFVEAAADDPDVVAIKSTVYRTGRDTPLAPALIRAAESGKQTVCVVEIKARGDEHRNIRWGQELERAGVHVVYGLPGTKIHAKVTLVVRREGDSLRRYAHIGTGNYNHLTAKAYEDFGLFVADEDIVADLAELFNYLTGFDHPAGFRELLVAPFNLRSRLIFEIRRVAEAASKGRQARIRIKVNGLSDRRMIDELYAASQAGASIDLVVRGVCSLRPGVPGLSDGIRVRSVLGRFLEHSRLFHFQAGDNERFLSR
jgi:polyphosphate kinase